MERILRQIGKLLRFVLARLVAALMAAIVILVTLQVAARYVFMLPTFGMAEVTRLLFIWLTFLGAALLVSRREMIAVDLFHDVFSPRWMRRMHLCNDVISAVTLIGFALYGRALLGIIGPKIAPATGLSYAWFYSPLLVFCVLALLFIFERLIVRSNGEDEVPMCNAAQPHALELEGMSLSGGPDHPRTGRPDRSGA